MKDLFLKHTEQIYHIPGPIFATVEVIILLPILGCNILIITAFCCYERLRYSSNIFIVNLSISDLIVGIAIPVDMAFHLDKQLHSNQHLCMVRYGFLLTGMGGSLCSLTCICLDRFVAIFYPLSYPNLMTKCRITILIIISWFMVHVAVVPILVSAKDWDDLNNTTCDEMVALFPNKGYTYFILGVATVIILLNVTLYMFVLHQAWTQINHIRDSHRKHQHNRMNKQLQKEIGKSKAMAIILGMFVVCWIPYLLFAWLRTVLGGQCFTNVKDVAFLLVVINSCLNGVIYGMMNTDFRWGMKKILRCGADQAVHPRPPIFSCSSCAENKNYREHMPNID